MPKSREFDLCQDGQNRFGPGEYTVVCSSIEKVLVTSKTNSDDDPCAFSFAPCHYLDFSITSDRTTYLAMRFIDGVPVLPILCRQRLAVDSKLFAPGSSFRILIKVYSS